MTKRVSFKKKSGLLLAVIGGMSAFGAGATTFPYREEFAKNDFTNFVIVDANNDGQT